MAKRKVVTKKAEPTRSEILQAAMNKAINDCAAKGVTDPSEVSKAMRKAYQEEAARLNG